MSKLFIGNINLDEYQFKKYKFIKKFKFLGGSAVNTIYFTNNLYKLFNKPEEVHNNFLIGVVGNDKSGKNALKLLEKKGINIKYVGIIEGNTGSTKISLDNENERTILRSESVNSKLINYISKEEIIDILKTSDIHLKTNLDVVIKIISLKNEIFSIDVSGIIENDKILEFIKIFEQNNNKQIKILLGNKDEFFILYNKISGKEIPKNLIDFAKTLKDGKYIIQDNEKIKHESELDYLKIILKTIRKYFNSKYLFMKMGRFGGLCEFENALIKKSALNIKVIDTTGAGDAFNAGVLYGIWNNIDLEKTLKLAIDLGSLNCTKIGGNELKFTRDFKSFKRTIT